MSKRTLDITRTKPSKKATTLTLVLDPYCPPGQAYYQQKTWFVHPNDFMQGKAYTMMAKVDKLEARHP